MQLNEKKHGKRRTTFLSRGLNWLRLGDILNTSTDKTIFNTSKIKLF